MANHKKICVHITQLQLVRPKKITSFLVSRNCDTSTENSTNKNQEFKIKNMVFGNLKKSTEHLFV